MTMILAMPLLYCPRHEKGMLIIMAITLYQPNASRPHPGLNQLHSKSHVNISKHKQVQKRSIALAIIKRITESKEANNKC